jgi:predicted protein tyrosine phosphatase
MGSMLPFELTICGEPEIACTLDRHSHAVSIMDPGLSADLAGRLPEANVLRLNFHDLDRRPPPDHPAVLALLRAGQSIVMPSERHVRAILRFGCGLPPGARVLIHCMAGISRSTAAAWMLGVQAAPGKEIDVLAHIRRLRPQAMPNRLMVAIADRLLGAEGRMVTARDQAG